MSDLIDYSILGPVLAMFLAKRTGRAERYVGAGTNVTNRETRHGQRETTLL